MNNSSNAAQERFIAFKAYLKFCKPYYGRLFFVLMVFVVSNITIALLPIYIGKLVQAATQFNGNARNLWIYVAILIGLSSLHDITWRGAEFAYRGLVNKIGFLYESFLFKVVINQPYPYFVDKLTGKISSYITTLGNEFRNLQNNMLFDFSGSLVSIIATILILGSLNWQTAAIFTTGILGMLFIGRKTLSINMKYEGIATDKDSSKNGILFDAISNFASVKALHTERREFAIIDRQQKNNFSANQDAFLSGILFWGSMSVFVRHFMWPAAIALNVYFFTQGKIDIGELATLLSTALIFTTTVWEGVWYISQFGQKMAHADEAHRYLFGTEKDLSADVSTTDTVSFNDSLSIINLEFAYPDKPDFKVLESISIHIKHGEKIGIVGRSGSGKSTLTKLLLDYYPSKLGELLVDNKQVTSAELATLIAFVPQDTSLFHRSISDNIAYGKLGEVSSKEIIAAAKLAEAHEFIKKLPEGYNTLIGERGVKLSGGQRQRIAIARAIIQDAPLLVLDEATSALDSESEQLIQDALWNLMKDRTAIVIAHRLSTIQKMDTIIVIDEGRIIEQGSHTQLLKKNGVYAKLWAHQSGGFLED